MTQLTPLVLATPWFVAVVWCWYRRPRDGSIPPSMAELARKRF
jgi:hypothetical protein